MRKNNVWAMFVIGFSPSYSAISCRRCAIPTSWHSDSQMACEPTAVKPRSNREGWTSYCNNWCTERARESS
ncbi:hypothetical protein C8Q70DRAFT_458260 [Cubamyces menziesii]|nr:hypothetical protein C8Q70DRAFT_458260 [Cubamyces menziesii]